MPTHDQPMRREPVRREPVRPGEGDPVEVVAGFIAGFGAGGRPLREVVARLTEGPWSPEALIRASGLSRRTVEGLISALGRDLIELRDGRLEIGEGRLGSYRELCGYDHLLRTRFADPLGDRLDAESALIEQMGEIAATAPTSRRALDHVAATPETVVRRAIWLDGTYDLAGRRLLCVGDHDLTSLAACQVNPRLAVTVVDLDERILEFIDEQARRLGLDIRCLHGDLRFGLPAGAAGWADLMITDPPYTPEGVRLFLTRGLEGLGDRENGRLLMAYGFGERQPGLGLKVQQAAQELNLVYEAILPDFNRYVGAQAVGSTSDLYVFRPTTRTWPVVERRGKAVQTKIYTHGPQSLEGAGGTLGGDVTRALLEAAAGPAPLAVAALVGDEWPPGTADGARVDLATLIGTGLPASVTSRGTYGVAVDLSADPGPWLLRALLAANAERLALLVPNGHPDLASGEGQRRLAELVGHKYALRFRRSTPGPRYAVVEATAAAPAGDDPAAPLARDLLSHAHGRLGNMWREALIRACREADGTTLTKNNARARIETASRRGDVLDLRLLDLPRHQIADLLIDAATTVGEPLPGTVATTR